jgi:hypothetical protein
MPKINPSLDWTDNLELDYNVQVEVLNINNLMLNSGNLLNYYVLPNKIGLNIISNENKNESNNFNNINSNPAKEYIGEVLEALNLEQKNSRNSQQSTEQYGYGINDSDESNNILILTIS